MKSMLFFLLLSTICFYGKAQQDTMEMSYLNVSDSIWGLLRNNVNIPSGRFANRTLVNFSETHLGHSEANTVDTLNADLYFGLLSELKMISFDNSAVISKLDYFYKVNELVAGFDFREEKTVIPMNVIDYDYQLLNETAALNNGILYQQNLRFNLINGNSYYPYYFSTRRARVCAPIFDYQSDETVYLYYDETLNITNNPTAIDHLEIMIAGQWLELRNGEMIELRLPDKLLHVYDVKVVYVDESYFSNKFAFSTPENGIKNSGKDKDINPFDEDDPDDTDFGVCHSSGHFQNGVCELNWCKVESYCPGNEKQYILVTGYRPPMFGQKFKKTWKIYNDWHNGLLQSIQDNGYDIVIVKFNMHMRPNQHGMAEAADLFVQFMDEVGYTPEYESVIQASSMGHDIARLALMKMDKRHMDGSPKQHHSRLLIAYDANVFGANIPLTYQALIYSKFFNSDPATSSPFFQNFLGTFLYAAMVQKSTRELLMYHIAGSPLGEQSFNANQETQNSIPSYNEKRGIFLDQLAAYDNHQYFFPLPNTLRNISISLGKISGTNDTETDINFNSPGEFWRDLNNGVFIYYLKSAIYDPTNYVKIFERKSLFGRYGILFNLTHHKLYVNKMLEIDNTSGSYLDGFGNIIAVADVAYFGLAVFADGALTGYSQFTHKPVATALGINHRYWHPDYGGPQNGSMSVDVHSLGLMFNDYGLDFNNLLLQSNHYGYPHLGRPNDHFDVTPFEAIYIDDHIDNHINLRYANQSDNDILNGFILNEVEPWYLGLQNQRLGSQARPDFLYVAKRRAKILITLGKHVTPTTDDGDYVVLPNADLRLEAGETIHFKDGFHAQAGSTMHAHIYWQPCEDMHWRRGNTNANEEQETGISLPDEKTALFEKEGDGIRIYPNPSSTHLTIHSEEKIEQIKMYSISGAEMNNFQLSSDEKRYFITHSLMKGSYLLHLKKEDELIIKQFVVL